MRKIVTAVTAGALALSMLAQAIPVAAVAGYDSAYAGESAFVNISAGQTQNFQVFFANTGTTTWTRGTSTQVDLAACLEDKITCNAQDATEAGWNSGWLSAVRYTTTTQTTIAPGSLGTFSYNITAPSGVAAGIFRFNGDLVLASTGERIHPEGYYQEANTGVAAGAATITSLNPSSGTTAGGTSVVITGTGIVCTPSFPAVSFGGTNAVVSSCGSTSVTAVSPAHAAGAVTVTLTNSGSAASNGLTYLYEDTTGATFLSFTASGDVVTVTFSEPVCRISGTPDADWNIQNVSSPAGDLAIAGTTDNLPTDCDDAVSTFDVFLPPGTNLPPGAFVEATLTVQGNTTSVGVNDNENIVDPAGNESAAPQSRQATATAPETTKPVLSSASGAVGQPNITLTFSENVFCDGVAAPAAGDFKVDDTSSSTDPTVTGFSSPCSLTRATADTSFGITISTNLKADTSYVVTICGPTTSGCGDATGEIQDTVGNTLTVPASVTFTSGAADFTPPTITDARMSANVGTSDFTEAGDAFTLTFNEVMTDTDEVGTIALQDQDGTTLTLSCAAASVTCAWNTADTTVTVTISTPLTADANGTTPGMQIPFNITTLSGTSFTDLQGNAVNVLGSSDRLVDFE